MVSKPKEHDINRKGRILFRSALESLGWVVNDVQEDYGIDSNVQVFDGGSPTGAWFHAQLKSSASSAYAADNSFLSQVLAVDHARHYALEMRQPVFVFHADVRSQRVFWYAPQLSPQFAKVLSQARGESVVLRIPTRQKLPDNAPELLETLDRLQITLATREVAAASHRSFVESLHHHTDQESLYRAFQEKNDTLKLRTILELYRAHDFKQARVRIGTVLSDPDSSIENKFWAQTQLEAVDFSETLHTGQHQANLSALQLNHAKALQKLVKKGPGYLKFHALINRKAAELGVLVYEHFALSMALRQHLEQAGNRKVALGLYARKSALTSRLFAKYNQCIRLVGYSAGYPDRWMLGRALTNIPKAIGSFLITLEAERDLSSVQALSGAALRICEMAARICIETGDVNGVYQSILSALMTTHSEDSAAFRWANETANRFVDPDARAEALRIINRSSRRWKGEEVEGDYRGDAIWQIFENMAFALGIDLSKDDDPLVRGLRLAAKDNNPARVLKTCEHILVGQGAMGPVARRIRQLFNTSMAGSKVVHCTLHRLHVEAKQLDAAYSEFKSAHCDSCPDRKPRAKEWNYTEEEQQAIQDRHLNFVAGLAGTPYGLRYTDED